MSKFCTNCGATLEDDAVFCPECGNRMDEAAGEAKAAQEAPAPEPAPAPAPAPVPAPVPDPAPAPAPEAPAERSKEVSTGAYFWIMLLFAIPGLGLIAMLIFSFLVKNKNLRNYGRACLIWIAVAIVLSVIGYIIIRIALRAAGVDFSLEQLFDNLRNVIPLY